MAIVEARNLRKYFGEVHAVDGINLTTEEGEFSCSSDPPGVAKPLCCA